MPRSLVSDTSPLDWLALPEGVPAVSGLPPGFAAYLNLLPPLGIDRSIPVEAYPFDTRTLDQLNARVSFWNTHGIHLGQPAPERLTPITYREVAAELGLAYTPDFDNRAIHRAYGGWPPHLGTSSALELARLPQLVSVLGPQTPTYFFGSVDEGCYRWDTDGMPVDWLERGTAVDLLDVVAEAGGWPTYTFAANHAWCLYQGEDQWLAIGCSAVVAQALQAQPALEILPLQ